MTSIQIPMQPSADEMLTGFFQLYGRRLSGRRLERHRQAERALRHCCETHLEEYLTDPERVLVATERELEPDDAATRLVEPHLLLAVLPQFVREPEWFGSDLEDRRVRLRLADRLLHFLLSYPPMSGFRGSCDAIEVRVALGRARVELELHRAQHRSDAPRGARG